MKKIIILSTVLALAGLPTSIVFAADAAPAVQPKTETGEVKAGTEKASAAAQTGPGSGTAPASPAKPILPVVQETPAQPPSVFTAKAQTVKVGFVDVMRVVDQSVQGKSAKAEMKAKADKLRSRVETRQKQLEKQKAEIEANLQTLTPQQRSVKAKEFQKKLVEFQKFVEKGQKDLQARESELLGRLYKSIEKSAGDYGKANGFAAVVVKRELLYLGDNVDVKDLTGDVIKMVNAEAGKKLH